jgi:hypothetical protein
VVTTGGHCRDREPPIGVLALEDLMAVLITQNGLIGGVLPLPCREVRVNEQEAAERAAPGRLAD